MADCVSRLDIVKDEASCEGEAHCVSHQGRVRIETNHDCKSAHACNHKEWVMRSGELLSS